MARSRNLISLGGPEGQKGTNSTLTSGTQNGRTIRLMREPRSWRNQPQRTGIHPRGERSEQGYKYIHFHGNRYIFKYKVSAAEEN